MDESVGDEAAAAAAAAKGSELTLLVGVVGAGTSATAPSAAAVGNVSLPFEPCNCGKGIALSRFSRQTMH